MQRKISLILAVVMVLSGWLFFGPREARGQTQGQLLPNGKVVGQKSTLPSPSLFPEPIGAFDTTNWFVSGALGVGTDVPAEDIEIKKTEFPFLLITETNGTSNAGINFANPVDPVGSFVYMSPDADLRFWTGGDLGADRMAITANGLVGIGTIAPEADLHVGQTDSAASPQFRLSAASANPQHFPYILFANGSTPVSQLISDVSVGNFVFDYSGGLGGHFLVRKALNSGNPADYVMFGTSDGRLVVGGTTAQSGAQVTVNGNLHVNGNVTKTGVGELVRIKDGNREFEYSVSVGPEVGTYIRGTARLENGKAVIELPEYFAAVTSKEGLTVQLTLLDDCNGLRVVEKGTKRIVVSELMGGTSNAKFDYLVQGIRSGQENHQVVYAR